MHTFSFKQIKHYDEQMILAQVGPKYPFMHVLQVASVLQSAQFLTILQFISLQVNPLYPSLHVMHCVKD